MCSVGAALRKPGKLAKRGLTTAIVASLLASAPPTWAAETTPAALQSSAPEEPTPRGPTPDVPAAQAADPETAARAATPVPDAEDPRAQRAAQRSPNQRPEPRDLGPPRRSAVYSLFGLGTPIGYFGLEGVHRFGDLLEVAAGFGAGASVVFSQKNPSPGQALQWAVMPRLRLGDDHNAFTAGVGLSGGAYTNQVPIFDDCSDCGSPPTHYTLWTNFEVGGEHWLRGFALRYFVGMADGCAVGSCGDSAAWQLLPFFYFGMGLGYAF